MARNDPQVNLRMPAELKDRLDASARQNIRSLTAEIVERLSNSLDAEQSSQSLEEAATSIAEAATAGLEIYSEQLKIERQQYKVVHSQMAVMKHLLARVLLEKDNPSKDLLEIIEVICAPDTDLEASIDDMREATVILLDSATDELSERRKLHEQLTSPESLNAMAERNLALELSGVAEIIRKKAKQNDD